MRIDELVSRLIQLREDVGNAHVTISDFPSMKVYRGNIDIDYNVTKWTTVYEWGDEEEHVNIEIGGCEL